MKDSTALIQENEIEGGGVAAVLVQGTATIRKSKFLGKGEKQGDAVWVWEGSTATIDANAFSGYRTAVSSTKATVIVMGNTVQGFTGPAIIIKDSAISKVAQLQEELASVRHRQKQLLNLRMLEKIDARRHVRIDKP